MLSAEALSGYGGWVVLIAVGGFVLLSGVVIIVGRRFMTSRDGPGAGDSTLVRSWIAIALVGGLLLFCGAAFAIDDKPLRNMLFGGLVASVGAAVAFYFSSKGADQARQDILSAAFGTSEVPKLVGMSVTDARAAMSKTPLQLSLKQPDAKDADVVTDQEPPAGTDVSKGSKVSVGTATPDAAKTQPPTAPTPTPAAPPAAEPATGPETEGRPGNH